MSNYHKRRIAPDWQVRMLEVDERPNAEISCDKHLSPKAGCEGCKSKLMEVQSG